MVEVEWWRPMWPRPPQEMLAPKIVVPEVFLVPRFGFDVSGKWVVSHSPFVYTPRFDDDKDLLLRADGDFELQRCRHGSLIITLGNIVISTTSSASRYFAGCLSRTYEMIPLQHPPEGC